MLQGCRDHRCTSTSCRYLYYHLIPSMKHASEICLYVDIGMHGMPESAWQTEIGRDNSKICASMSSCPHSELFGAHQLTCGNITAEQSSPRTTSPTQFQRYSATFCTVEQLHGCIQDREMAHAEGRYLGLPRAASQSQAG